METKNLIKLPGGYHLLRPISLEIQKDGDWYFAIPPTFVLHGFGSTPEEAIEDYGIGLVEYYEDLKEDKQRLAPHLLEHLEFLESIIVTDDISRERSK